MSSLASLPCEILDDIVFFVDAAAHSRRDVKNLRLTCKRLLPICSRILYHDVRVFLSPSSLDSFDSIVSATSSSLQNFPPTNNTRTLSIDLSPCQPEDNTSSTPYDITASLENRLAKSINHITSWPKLSSINLINSKSCPRQDTSSWEACAPNDFGIVALINAINGTRENCPLNTELVRPKIRNLSMKNVMTPTQNSAFATPAFQRTLSDVTSLHLQICPDFHDTPPQDLDDEIRLAEGLSTVRELWLEPTMLQLTSLSLYSDAPWGVLPKLDTRGLHFPKLKSLALGNWSIRYDWQLDFITSHASTLEDLSMDACHIVTFVPYFRNSPVIGDIRGAAGAMDFMSSMKMLQGVDMQQIEHTWSSDEPYYSFKNEITWHKIFTRLEKSLTHLKRFRFGNGPWSRDEAFECRDRLEGCELTADRYKGFDGRVGHELWPQWSLSELDAEAINVANGWTAPYTKPVKTGVKPTAADKQRFLERMNFREGRTAMNSLLRSIEERR